GDADAGILQFPAALLEHGALSFDAFGKLLLAIVLEHRDAGELEALIESLQRVDHRGAIGAVLTQPRARISGLEQRVIPIEGAGVESFRFAAGGGGDRIVGKHKCDAEQEGDDQSGQNELPNRNAGGAHHDELGGTAQHQEHTDRSHPHSEGKREFGEGRQAKQRHPCEQEAGNILLVVARSAKHFDEVDEEDQHAAENKHRNHRDEESQRKIARKSARCTDALHLRSHCPRTPLRAQRFLITGLSLSSKLSLDRSSGDILTCAAHAATRIAPIGIAYTRATADAFRVTRVPAVSPATRSPIAMPKARKICPQRFSRVVRAWPSNATAMRAKTMGYNAVAKRSWSSERSCPGLRLA